RLTQTVEHTLTLFADRGYESIGRFIEATVPAPERERAADVFVKIMQGAVWEAWLMTRERSGQAAPALDENNAVFLRDSIAALSDSLFYGAPVYLQLTAYDERQATVLQATRSPGKALVFLGSLLLVLGVFAMLYIRERRLFVLIKPNEVLMAMSSNRKAIDVDETFQRHVDGLRELFAAPENRPT
ncbi:MAG: cytochrome c biogenesis protein ResB, partial [Proteobacteria bacterium]|nr:cytochrome c biogenesis protein ResB [Pseudomonadota bacterium]